jgi:signal transduction histidine kinase
MRVLLVSGSEAGARQLREALPRGDRPPLEVVTATDLESALRHLAEDGVDLILVDLELPSDRGLPALETLKRQAPAVPVLAFVARRSGPNPGTVRTAEASDPPAARAAGGEADPPHGALGSPATISRLAPLARMASIGQLTGGVAHEVNNLLCALSNQLQVLQLREDLDPELVGTIETMEGWVRQAAGSVGVLLEYALRPQGTRSRVDVQAATSRMLLLLRSSPRFRHLDLDTEFVPLLPLPELDEAAWDHIVFELAANAAEATATKGSLRIRARPLPGPTSSSGIEVCFEDDGPGIPAEHLPRVFEPFFTTRDAGEHLGLGLTLVRSLLRAHRGDIRIEANRPTGVRILIRLPVPDAPPN